MRGKIRWPGSQSTSDDRAMSTGGTLGMLAAVVVVVSVVTAGVSVPSGSSDAGSPQSEVQVVANGVESSLEDTNQQVVNKDAASDNDPRKRFVAKVMQAIPDHAWKNMPPETRNRLRQHLGSFIGQVEAQAAVDGELTRVQPAGEGVVQGVTLKQHGTGQHTITDTVEEQYTVQETVFDHWERYLDGYNKVFDGWKTVVSHYKKVKVGTRLKPEYYTVRHKVLEYSTRTVVDWEKEWYTYRERHTRRVQECGWEGGWSWGPGSYECSWETEVYYTTERDYRWQKTYKKETYVSGHHYETEVKHRLVSVPVYEEKPVYEQIPTYDYVPDYDKRAVYKTVDVQKTRTKQVDREVQTAPFVVEEGEGDWTLAKDVTKYRDATMRIEKTMLSEKPSEAMVFRADSQPNGDTWTLTAYRDGDQIVLQTSDGVTKRVSSEFAKIDFDSGTVNGDNVDIHLAEDVEGPYTLKFRNGDKARGTYKMNIVGNASIDAQTADIANDEAGVTVVDGVIYSATFDVTYETADTTYTDRITIEPDVVIGDQTSSEDENGNGNGHGRS